MDCRLSYPLLDTGKKTVSRPSAPGMENGMEPFFWCPGASCQYFPPAFSFPWLNLEMIPSLTSKKYELPNSILRQLDDLRLLR